MVLTSHVAVGLIIYDILPDPVLALIVIVLSHFLLDIIPHVQAPTDENYTPTRATYPIILIDVFASVLFVYWIVNKSGDMGYVMAALVSISPDLLDATRYFKIKAFDWYYAFHDKIQNETNGFIGYLTQMVLVLGTIGYFLWLK